MTPATLTTIGESLYGTAWQSDLARALDVAPRTMQRWVSGAAGIPEIEAELAELCAVRGNELLQLARQILHAQAVVAGAQQNNSVLPA